MINYPVVDKLGTEKRIINAGLKRIYGQHNINQ